jgi:hypothetical protein
MRSASGRVSKAALLSSLVAVLCLGGCEAVLGLGSETSLPGDASADGPTMTTSHPDAGDDAGADGWTQVAFNASGTATCPGGFTSMGVVEVTTSGSCACSNCSNTGGLDCESTMNLATMVSGADGGTMCSTTGDIFVGNGGMCETNAVSPVASMSITASPPTAGTCTATATVTDPKGPSEIVCTPDHCAGDCTSNLGSGLVACLYKMGDQTCPAKMTKHAVGSSATTTCGTCACSATATGCSGTFAVYASPTACTGSPVVTLPADGTCHPLTGVTGEASYIYTASPTDVSCDAGAATATDTLHDEATLCCP